MGVKNAVWDLLKYTHGRILATFIEDRSDLCQWWEVKNRLVWSIEAALLKRYVLGIQPLFLHVHFYALAPQTVLMWLDWSQEYFNKTIVLRGQLWQLSICSSKDLKECMTLISNYLLLYLRD